MLMQLSIEQLNSTPEKIKSVAFTGHRETKINEVENLLNTLVSLIERGARVFYCGMAKGFDLFAAECVLSLKETYPDISLIACIPCYGQEKAYSEADKKRYVQILSKTTQNILVSENYFKGCMQKRNRYMADRADVLVAHLKKDAGGTAYTVNYFLKKNKEIIYV